MRPTHVVMNFGLWLADSQSNFGDKEGVGQPCPYLPSVCAFLTEEQPFRVIWQTSTPKLKGSSGNMSHIGDGHHLHIPARCKLNATSVLNRVEVLHALEPDLEQRIKLFQDDIHLTPAAYHAFNGMLLDMIILLDEGHGQLFTLPDQEQASPSKASPEPSKDENHPEEGESEPSEEQVAQQSRR